MAVLKWVKGLIPRYTNKPNLNPRLNPPITLILTLNESITDGPYWTSEKNSLEMLELSSINKN